MRKYSVSIRGHRTSYSLEEPFQKELLQLARKRKQSVASLITEIDEARTEDTNLSSAIRLRILEELSGKRVSTS